MCRPPPIDPRIGLVWDDSGWDLEPQWAREPQIDAIEAVCRRALGIKDHREPCTATFHAAGAFNRLYLITTLLGKSLIRVTLPVDPKWKTQGEVATLRWLRHGTNVPVPRVVAFDDAQDNELGFEWILME
ncbi:altered inheritance of mitochondria 9, mitochondrial [Cladorrhinum sp. PSN332]|nr:altered inheritance of mitochondria 9, mitochondrial [Cladorrhinum sp. PSN332]